MRRRVEVAERLLAFHLDRSVAQRAIMAELGVSHQVASKLVTSIYDRWALDGDPAQREQRRSSLRAGAESVYRAALSKRSAVHDASGRPVIDPDTKRAVTKADPDLKNALGALHFLARLDGLLTPDLGEGAGGGGLAGVISLVVPSLGPHRPVGDMPAGYLSAEDRTRIARYAELVGDTTLAADDDDDDDL